MSIYAIKFFYFYSFSFLLLAFSCQNPPAEKYELSLIEMMDVGNYTADSLSIVVDKSDYQLHLMAGVKSLKIFPVVFGSNPIDDKRIEGDRCTPEGHFGIRDMYPHARWKRFIWIDYPNSVSWEKFHSSLENGEIPHDATIGGELGIHGVPEGRDDLIENKVNWTWGCISMKNADVEELYRHITKETEIFIQE